MVHASRQSLQGLNLCAPLLGVFFHTHLLAVPYSGPLMSSFLCLECAPQTHSQGSLICSHPLNLCSIIMFSQYLIWLLYLKQQPCCTSHSLLYFLHSNYHLLPHHIIYSFKSVTCLFPLECNLPEGKNFCQFCSLTHSWGTEAYQVCVDWLTKWMSCGCPDTFCYFVSWGLQGYTHVKDNCAASLFSSLWQEICRESSLSWKVEREGQVRTLCLGREKIIVAICKQKLRNTIYVKLLLNFEHLPNKRHTIRCCDSEINKAWSFP